MHTNRQRLLLPITITKFFAVKKFTLLICSGLLMQAASSQFSLTYNANGQLVQLQEKKEAGLAVTLPPDNAQRAEAIKTLKEKCAKTAALLKSNSGMYVFYKRLWGTTQVNEMQKELEAIATDAPPATRHFSMLTTLLPNLNTAPIYAATAGNKEVTLQLTNIVNQLLIQHYKSTANDPLNQPVTGLTLKQYAALSDFLSDTYENHVQLLTGARLLATENNRLALLAANTQLHTPAFDSKIALLKTSPWFYQWLWYTEGAVRLNPFEFVNTAFFDKYPLFDKGKAALYNAYVDSVINRHIRYDTAEKLDEIKKLLNARQTGVKEFSYKDRIDKMKEENKAALAAVTTVTKTLNTTSFPFADNKIQPHLYYSTQPEFTGVYGYQPGETGAIATTDRKLMVVHNVSQGTEIALRESGKPFTDVSAFRKFTDEVNTQITSLIPGLISASGIVSTAVASLQSTNIPVPVLQPATAKAAELHANPPPPAGRETLPPYNGQEVVKESLEAMGIFNQDLFNQLMATPAFSSLVGRLTTVEGALFKQIINEYTIAFLDLYNQALVTASNDSLLLYHFNNAITNSTIPPAAIKATNVETPALATVIKKTSVQEETITNEVRLVALKEKDSTVISSFKYNTGKRHRYQLTAGLAYSFPDPVENELIQNGSQAVVTQKKEPIRVIAGINVYLGKGLFLQDNRVRFTLDRLAVFAGVSISSPLKNIYTALSCDVVPSVRLAMGAHFHNITEYTLQNNQEAAKNNKYKPYPFAAITIDPVSLVSTLNIFK